MNGRTNVTVGASTDFQIPLDPCTSLGLKAGNAQVEITWTDPVDKYATPAGEQAQDPQPLISVWDHTVLVRKTGSQPTGPHDGTTVVSSSVRNQYQSMAYTDTGLINDTTYHYGAFAYNTAGLASKGIFNSATPMLGTPLENLAVGTVVKTPIDGTPKEFIVVHQGKPDSMYDDSCDGTWLLMKDIYTSRRWGASSDYKISTIHSYLNSTFLNLFDDGIKNIVKQVKIPYQNGEGIDGSIASGANGLSCKIFLPSCYELGWTTNDYEHFFHDGAKLSYFSSGTSSSANNKRIAKYNGNASDWWTRSTTPSTYHVWNISSSGDYEMLDCGSFSSGVRPLLILPPNTCGVDDELNILAPSSQIAT